MDGTYDMYVRTEKCIQNFGRKTSREDNTVFGSEGKILSRLIFKK
jgi:hypothetical protein